MRQALLDTPPLLGHTHRLMGQPAAARELLVLAGYDYFLNKHDLQYLLGCYREIVLIPQHPTDALLLNSTVQALCRNRYTVDLITNPDYGRRLHLDFDPEVFLGPNVRLQSVAYFCERVLGKIYISEDPNERNQRLALVLPFSPAVRIFKRFIDVLLASLLLLPGSLAGLLSGVIIRRQSPGPVLYRQTRVGEWGEEFVCLKLRSMHLDAEAGGATFSRRADPRTFPFGAYLRSRRIDEIPQLLNVLRGELSLVGPRPERRVFTEWFEEIIPHYARRHAIRPGITGYAQIRYGYGTGAVGARHKLMYDLYYLHCWSLGLELRILAGTSLTVWRGRER